VERTAAFYDAKCLACHSGGPETQAVKTARRAKPCTAATQNCVACHMPKYEIPGSHTLFCDHQIRIAKPGEPYPG
jgi:mono/diheme cytochrome c family protein